MKLGQQNNAQTRYFLSYLDMTYCISKNNVTDITIITDLKNLHHAEFNLKLVVAIFAMLNIICYIEKM